jgi:hypothetical protein
MIKTGAVPAPLPAHRGVSPSHNSLNRTLPTPWADTHPRY